MDNFAVSIIVPTLNEATVIHDTLERLQALRHSNIELIVVDGGSTDNTLTNIESYVDRIVSAPTGRARQMNAGAAVAKGEWLLFLHADTRLPETINQWLSQLRDSDLSWGFFAVRLDGRHWLFRCIEYTMNLRSRLTRVATGDQCLFIKQTVFEQVGRYPDIPLMEDVAISKKLRSISRPLFWPVPIVTSSRRWERKGIIATILLMWRLRLAYFLGACPHALYRAYYD